MNRLGRGYSFEALRAKILFTEGSHKHKLSRPKFERRRETEPQYNVAEELTGYAVAAKFAGISSFKSKPQKAIAPHIPDEAAKNYGADINTLIALLDAGKL